MIVLQLLQLNCIMEEQEIRRLSLSEKISNVDRMLRRLEVKTGDVVQPE